MTYKVDGVPFIIQPTTGRWVPRQPLGIDGENRAIYPPVYDFELDWVAVTPGAFKQIYDFWRERATTGTNSVSLPGKGENEYTFVDYSDCVLDEPQQGEYFEKHLLKIKLVVRNIVVP